MDMQESNGGEELTLSSYLAIEGQQGSRVIAYRRDTKARVQLAKGVYEIMQEFSSPCSVEHATRRLDPAARGRAGAAIQMLRHKGFLVPCEEKDRFEHSVLRMASPTLFQSPRGNELAAGDIAVIGVPFDLGSRLGTGSRDAPEAIRRRSFDHDYRVDFSSGQAIGWHDIDHSRRILEGVDIRDWGDVAFRWGECPAAFYARVEQVIVKIVQGGANPVVIGGDQSSTFAVIKGLLSRYGELAVVWLDAHTDTSQSGESSDLHNGNVARRILELDGVVQVVQGGLRGYSLYDKIAQRPKKQEIVTAVELNKQGPEALLRHVRSDVPYYVSLDIDILDPAFAPAVAGPIPFGLTPGVLRELITALDERKVVVGFDVMEVAPALDHGITTVALVCQLLLAGMSAIASFRSAVGKNVVTSIIG